jgi:hypothetical protein
MIGAMKRLAAAALASLAYLLAGCTATPAASTQPPLPVGETVLIDADPAKGFHYPYLLRMPATPLKGETRLLVEPNNTGLVSDDPDVHLDAARKLSQNALGAATSRRLNLPLLVPVFPRPKTGWEIYTHQLDRDSMLIESGPMRRLDLQLIAMIEDAQRRLRATGVRIPDGVLMTGFSASGTFTNRFTLLHPHRVRAAATGGLNGLLMVPAAAIGSVSLPYPIGTADVRTLTGRRVDVRAWRRVPQFIYMGELDDNDALHFDDGYNDDERGIVYTTLGERMQPDRWSRVQQIYREAGANVTFRTYEKIGHATDKRIADEVIDFFRTHL